MVAGMIPGEALPASARPHVAAILARGKDRPNGAQLATWRQRAADAAQERDLTAKDNRSRRNATWHRWRLGWAPKQTHHQSTHTTHADRAQLCAAHGVPNTGRQWRRLRRALARQGRAS